MGKLKKHRQGKTEGRIEGELQEARRMLVIVVKVRFPALAELAEQDAAKITNTGTLEWLIQKTVTAPDENFARWLLSPLIV